MTSTEKPTMGFNTPYQILLNDLTLFYKNNLVQEFTPDYAIINTELNFNESNTDIELPISVTKDQWETNVLSYQNNISKPLKLRFNTISIYTFIKEYLDIDKHAFKIGRITDTKYGFYIASSSEYPVLKIPSNYDFNESIKFNGIEIPLNMFKVNMNENKLIIESPGVNGFIYIDK